MSGLPFNSTDAESPTPCFNPFDDKLYLVVAAAAAVSGLISLLASTFIICIIILFRKYQFFGQRLILYLAISTVVKSLTTILQRVDYTNKKTTPYNTFCILSGFLNQVSAWMVLNSVVCITLSLLTTAFFDKQRERLEPYFLFFIFVFPFTINWIPFVKLAYGNSGVWCWIRSTDEDTCQGFTFGQAMQLTLWYIPLFVIMVILIILYVVILIKVFVIRQKWTGRIDPQAENNRRKMQQKIFQLLSYPLIFFLLNIPLFINRMQILVAPDKPEIVLWFLAAAAFPLEGGIIAIAFSLDPSTRRRLTPTHLRAAISEFGRKKRIDEYPMENKMEDEVSLEEDLLKQKPLINNEGGKT